MLFTLDFQLIDSQLELQCMAPKELTIMEAAVGYVGGRWLLIADLYRSCVSWTAIVALSRNVAPNIVKML